jgi:ADP-heptose:LPS heptosyltransferase
MEPFLDIIRTVRSEFPDAKIYCITNVSAEQQLSALSTFEDIFTFETQMFMFSSLGFGRISQLRKKQFDMCILPYNNLYGEKYRRWRIFMFLIGAKYRVICDGMPLNILLRPYVKSRRIGTLYEIRALFSEAAGVIIAPLLLLSFVLLIFLGLCINFITSKFRPMRVG